MTGVAHDDVPEYLNAMDLLCAPSQTTARWREQFGRMLIEAMACGVPVVASRSGEIPYVVGDAGASSAGGRRRRGGRPRSTRVLADELRRARRGAARATASRGSRASAPALRVAGRGAARISTFFEELIDGADDSRLRSRHHRRLPRRGLAEHGSRRGHAARPPRSASTPRAIEPTLIRPPLRRRADAVAAAAATDAGPSALDRIANRLWDYPRSSRGLAGRFDLFHIVDHSYAQLVHALPPGRTLVTCHDLDTFRSVLEPELEPRSAMFRAMTRRILDGLRKAGHVACDSDATRDALVARAGIAAERTTVVPNGPHPSCTPDRRAGRRRRGRAPARAARRIVDLLHVGSTIARKRIDVLLRVFARCVRRHRQLRLMRVGGPFTAEQRRSRASSGSATRSSSCRRSIARRWRRSTGAARCC